MPNPKEPRAGEQITVLNLSENKATFTAVNATEIFTSSAHGLSNGDCVTVASSTTLPNGLSASTYYYIITVTTNTFQLSTTPGGSVVTISDDGTGTHTWYQERETDSFDASPYDHLAVAIHADSSPNLTIFCMGSEHTTKPTFLDPQSDSNSYDFQDMVDKEDQQQIEGDDGFAIIAEDHRRFVVNDDSTKWLAFKTKDFKGGDVIIRIRGFRKS